jgi:hypothetical protein
MIFVVAALAGGCANTLYPGPRRPKSEVAVVETDATSIDSLDGQHVGTTETIEILPGPHSIGIALLDVQVGYVSSVAYSDPVKVCFEARPGRTYRTRPGSLGARTWEPEIIDTTNQIRVKVRRCNND